jgi:hypothetical protein
VRDVTEEGIEPHPGPTRVCNKNIDGLVTRYSDALYQIECNHARSPILAVCLQEHNFTRQKLTETRVAEKAAIAHGLLFLCAPMPGADHKGGAAIIIPHATIELKPGESQHNAITRMIYQLKPGPPPVENEIFISRHHN